MATEDGGKYAELEARIQAAHEAGDHGEAARVALRGYGPELLGYLVGVTRQEALALELFSQLSEDIWRGLPGFGWRSSFRTWAYVLCRNAWRRHHRRDPSKREDALSEHPGLANLVQEVRTATVPWLRTEVKEAVRSLRDKLTPEERDLLILRVDRGLDWKTIVLLEHDGAELDSATLRKQAAKLRKRFERLRRRLAELARAEGLVK